MSSRALWTAASGMIAQQLNVDVISNNLANVNTTGFKKKRAEFKDMLYETMDRAYTVGEKGKPVNLQVGHGVNSVSTVTDYQAGTFEKTDSTFDFAIEGESFFTVMGPAEEVVYTRDGSFKLVATTSGSKVLTTSDGYPILDTNETQISFDDDTSKVIVSAEGDISYTDNTGNIVPTGIRLGLVKFQNTQGLENIGKNFYQKTSASGDPVPDGELGVKSVINQGFLESANVQVVEEMVKLIIAQRAYEINSKAIQSADEMLSMANNLRRG